MEGRKNTLEFVKPALTEPEPSLEKEESRHEAVPVCENGVCTISWKPQRPVAA